MSVAEPAKQKEIDVPTPNGRLHCLLKGEGAPLLLLHGALGTGLAHFRRQVDDFATAYRVIVPDFLGYGNSGPRASFGGNFYERDAQDIAALIQHLDLPPVHLCGFSDGAVVAIIVAADYSPLVRSLILLGGQAVLDERTLEESRRLVPVENLPERLQEALARYHGDPYWKKLVADYVETMERMCREGGDVAQDRVAMIDCPTLIIQGEEDSWVGVEHAHMLHRLIQRSRLVIHPGVGHEVHREQPEVFNRQVLEFLSALPRV